MNDTITDALIELSTHPVGFAEAATLFLCRDGATAPVISERTSNDMKTVRGRLQSLLRKKLVKSGEFAPTGHVRYFPTPAGLRIIEAVTPPTNETAR